jgi:hypothetical protein
MVGWLSDVNDNGLFVEYQTSRETKHYYAAVLAIAKVVTKQHLAG